MIAWFTAPLPVTALLSLEVASGLLLSQRQRDPRGFCRWAARALDQLDGARAHAISVRVNEEDIERAMIAIETIARVADSAWRAQEAACY